LVVWLLDRLELKTAPMPCGKPARVGPSYAER
jgi:hypothetical protein